MAGSRRVYVGVDLGGKFHEVQVTDEAGGKLGRSFRIGRGRAGVEELEACVAEVAGVEAEAVYTVEATQNYWLELVHPLKRAGRRVYLVSPSKSSDLRGFYRKHTKTDAIDAAATSRVPVVDPALHEAVVSEPRVDAVRRLARQSWQLRERMSARKRRIMTRVLMVYPGFDGVFRDRYCGAALLFCRRYLDPAKARQLGRKRLAALLKKRAWGKFDEVRGERLWVVIGNAPELDVSYGDLQFLVNQDLDLLEAEERSQQAIRERMAELYHEIDPECRLLTMPGLGEFLAATITAFIGEPGRYSSADQVVALAGLHPRKRSSAGTDKAGQPLSRHGDPTLRSCLYVAAGIARQYDPELAAFYGRLRKRGKHHKVVICALAAKVLRRCFAILKADRPYVVEHQAAMKGLQKEAGKTVRESVHEVAELLNDCGEPSSPEEAVYAGPGGPTSTQAMAPRNRVKRAPPRP